MGFQKTNFNTCAIATGWWITRATMLLDNDLLLAQHSGVATVWLLSTLGNKTSYKKISKREIQSVSIPQTCDVIKNPPSPMALRLTSNLLYGVALIYKQKTDYLNNDASIIRTKLQRDLFNVNNGNRDLLIKQPNYIIKPTELNHIAHGGKSLNGGHNQVLLNDDPLFNVNEGLLPSLDDLDFLGPGFIAGDGGTGTQLRTINHRKSQIRNGDLENNTISVIQSTITNSTEEGDVFTRHRAINEDDQIMDAGNPDFAFDEEGMLLSLHDDETTGQGPVGLGTNARAISTPLREGKSADFDFDFDFGVDLDRVEGPVASGIAPLSAQEGNELDQILEEIDENSHVVGEGNQNAPIAPQRKRKKVNNNAHFIEIVVDDNISLQTNDLRSFRDNYVEAMESQRKTPKPQRITVQDLIVETDELLPSFHSRNILLDEERRGRSREREVAGGDEDFVDGLLRNTRRSSESIEVRRNASSTRRDSRRASMSSIHLPLDNDNPRDETTGGDFELDLDFEFGNIHDFEEQQLQHSGSDSRKRSSSVQRFPALEEDQVHHFHDENLESREIEKKTMKFLTFIEARFDEEDVYEMNFKELMKQNDDAVLDRSVIVKSFYEVLQLTTLNSLKIAKDEDIDKFELLNGNEFTIRLTN